MFIIGSFWLLLVCLLSWASCMLVNDAFSLCICSVITNCLLMVLYFVIVIGLVLGRIC